ncbi:MAG: SDR family oxidoreductase [Elusimicrobiota bacterium]
MSRLEGQVALVTGASGGIGAAIAKALAGQGCAVGLHYSSNGSSAKALAAKLNAIGGRAKTLKADLLKDGAPRQLVSACVKEFGRLDILVNNAGAVLGDEHFLDLSERDWARTLRLNAEAPFFLTQEAFRVMKTGARVINISSVAAQFGGSSRSIHYGAAKAALEAMTRGFAREGAGRRILVNAIRAGVIDTAFHDKFRKNMGPRIEMIPLKRMGRAEDVAAMALYLAVDGGFTTGQVLCVTGGE